MTAAVAAPAALFLGAGTAQATARFDAIPTPGGVTVVIHSDQPDPPGGNCFYSARADGNPIGKPAPIANVPFFLPQGAEATLWFPSFPTDSLWTISVSCDTGGTQFGFARY
jgi:hypothetical protein